MSFDRLSSLEAGSGPSYSDDPAFRDLLGSLHNQLQILHQNISQLRTDVKLIWTRRDTARVRERVHTKLEQSRKLCQELGEEAKKLQTWPNLTKQQKYDQSKITTQIQDALREFQNLQKSALEKEKAYVSAAKAAVGQDAHGELSESYSDDGQVLLQQQQQQQQQQQAELIRLAPQSEVDFQEALILEREEEIRNIEQGVGDLNVLFRQVAQIVSEQGETLTTIADNVENARDNTRSALVENTQAARYQKAARNRSCILLLILGIILAIIILAILV